MAERLEVLDGRPAAATPLVGKNKLPIKGTMAGHNKIVARAHWSMGYRDQDNNLHWKLMVLGTNDWENTLSELLFCVAAVQGDQPVFGIATDAIGFMFVAIHNRKVFVSGIVDWFEENELVVYFFDYILRDMIESCSMDNTQSAVDDLEDI